MVNANILARIAIKVHKRQAKHGFEIDIQAVESKMVRLFLSGTIAAGNVYTAPVRFNNLDRLGKV
jgi:hypothetical protein